ncbi:MAG: glycerophosphodiester phosphodiesterase [Promethearchaeota archaeon]
MRLDPSKFYTIGHRGNEVYDPENSIPAFKRAIDFGVDMIEMDLQMTKDEKFIIFHDRKLNMKTNGTGSIKEHNLEELTKLKYVYKGKDNVTPLVSIDNLLEFYKNLPLERRPILIMELKGDMTKETLRNLIIKLDDLGMLEKIIFSSFEQTSLKKVTELNYELFSNNFNNTIKNPLKKEKRIEKQIFKTYLSPIINKNFSFPINFKFLNNSRRKQIKTHEKLEKMLINLRKIEANAISLNKHDLNNSIINFFKMHNLFVFGWGIRTTKHYSKYILLNKTTQFNGFTAIDPVEQIKLRKNLLGY